MAATMNPMNAPWPFLRPDLRQKPGLRFNALNGANSAKSQTEGEHSLGSSGTLPADLFSFQAPIFQPPVFHASAGKNRFAVIGDAGTGDAAQYNISRQMEVWRQQLPFNQVLVLGDNVYPAGEPALFDERITQPYQNLRRQGVQFFPVLGNHDVKAGFGNQQLAYWGVPPYYSFKMGSPGADVEIFAVDTTVMLPGYLNGFDHNPAAFAQRDKAQSLWLEEALARSNASMKVVMGHYPLFSKAAFAKPKRLLFQQTLERKLSDILVRHQVDLYLAGHEHHYEAPVGINGVRYMVSGAGGGKLDLPQKGVPEGAGVVKKNHFMLFENTPAGLSYRVISDQGKVFDFGLIPRKRRVLDTLI
ncbi:metallophosphoesterase [Vampirovibrio sp.]|uniref:metallophosphoesterase family protein n=1 Tax=Vampirovibrio sp. TaxID=2717857 RepID=UPI0035947B86